LIDSRHELQEIDKDFMQWLAENKIAFSIIFTKSDKLSKTKLEKNLADFKKKMLDEWESLPEIFVTSSNKKQGLQEILKYISKLNLEYKPSLES
jgi:GTP-binding protein